MSHADNNAERSPSRRSDVSSVAHNHAGRDLQMRKLAPQVSWAEFDRRNPTPVVELTRRDLPNDPGVYVLYLDGDARYIGMASDLQQRVWGARCSQAKSVRRSALRRNLAAEVLEGVTAADLSSGRRTLNDDERDAVRRELERGGFVWMVCRDRDDAKSVERQLLAERPPALNQRT